LRAPRALAASQGLRFSAIGPDLTSAAPLAYERAAPPDDVRVGRPLAQRYVLTRHVASGGMAAVWEATDEVLGRRVAVKILHPHLATDATFLARFRAEARSAARLSQASVVAIFDTVSEPGCEAIVMELVDGVNLRTFLDEHGPLPTPDAVALADQVAVALEAAHDAGLVHRDIKPANILLCPDRRVKVTDFGIAKAIEADDHTTCGTLLGTAKYLAPEQVAGEPVDARADLYSLGIVLYEALTGTVPFDEDTAAATALARLQREPPPIRFRRPDVSPALADVVHTALARRPEDRYRSAAAMRTALGSAMQTPPPPMSVDATVAMASPSVPASPRPPAGIVGPAPAVIPGRDHLRGAIVAVAVLGALILAITLVAATTIGRDLYTQASDGVVDLFRNDAADGARPAPDPVVTTNDGAESIAAASISDGAMPLIDAVAFDPEGDGQEHDGRARLAVDDRADTFWHTERYDRRDLGNLKGGVGLVVATDTSRPLQTLQISSPTKGWAARVFVSDGVDTDLADWDAPVDGRVGIDGSVDFDLRGVKGSHVLIWITDLGDGQPRPRVEISEVALS